MRPTPLLVALTLSLATLAGCGDGGDDRGADASAPEGPAPSEIAGDADPDDI
jgi:hypothetical protein